ncbi:glycogen synthase GlgA [Marinimicrobium alkaliphilum]|uniref:glycogen synthase GlgA n=1 Tax=Marinimicrobium alkaliphilum TaxID=2202654 RepID=UPI000DB905BB|nr:glycogen synthase GlgA [Marinimicrobium alkaliphilum]
MIKTLFVSSEAHPLIKTGGLGDVAGSLPRALARANCDVRLVLPAYPDVLEKSRITGMKAISEFTVLGEPVTLWQTRLPGTRVLVWLVDHPYFSARPGNPYCASPNQDWPDNHLRFMLFCRAACELAMDRAGLNWRADIVHANDWQTGPLPLLLNEEKNRPGTVFTIHNLTYRGLFTWDAFDQLKLGNDYWHFEKLEFFDYAAFIKGGLVYADYLTTVSPSYALEMQQPEHGWGLDGLLRSRSDRLVGILNGINTDEWNPGTDQSLAQRYNRNTLKRKAVNKAALQEALGLKVEPHVPLLGFIGRLVEQKGIDLLLQVLPGLLKSGRIQFALLGSGMSHYEASLTELARSYPGRLSVTLGYSEELSHQIEAGADLFLMPSMFEPCGLNQLYSLRYGTPPVVHNVGGLKDTIIDADANEEEGNGFVFPDATAASFLSALERALAAYTDGDRWRKIQLAGMKADYSWDASAEAYRDQVYRPLLEA